MNQSRITPIDPDFFNDGHFVVLLSQSRGGSGMDPHKLAGDLPLPGLDEETNWPAVFELRPA